MMFDGTGERRLPELLSPAGSPEALDAAIEGGADAVYLGGIGFNARAGAKNFDTAALREGISRAHAYGVRVYVTLNTQVYDRELADWLSSAEEAYTAGADALILADAGAAALCRRYFPDFELHASTQMSGHNADMTAGLKTLGFSRMVIARETSLENLGTVCKKSPVEIELFVHGALCVSCSGQCLFSFAVGGRSGNRGECAQPCRLPYGGNRYPLSLKDLCLAAYVPELIASGVSSLKIEGRMKSPAYVYGVTRIWRRLLDERRTATAEEMRELAELFSRGGFTDGYFRGKPDGNMLGIRSRGDKAVSRALPDFGGLTKKVPLDMKLTVRAGSPTELTVTDGRGKTVTVRGAVPETAENRPTTADALLPKLTRLGTTPYAARHTEIDIGDGLLFPFSVLNELRRAAIGALTETGRVSPGLFRGNATPEELCEIRRETENALAGREAPSFDTTEHSHKEQESIHAGRRSDAPDRSALLRSGGHDGHVFLPERQAVCYHPRQMTKEVRAYFDRVYLPAEYFGNPRTRQPTDRRAAGWETGTAGQPYPYLPDGVLLPPVIPDSEREEVLDSLCAARAAGVKYALVGNIGHYAIVREAGLCPVGDFRLNVCNAASLAVQMGLGCESVILSPELTLPRLRDLTDAGGAVIVYGRIPLMVLEKCVGLEIGGCTKCREGKLVLTDRMGAEFPVLRTPPHRSLIFNSVPTYMADRTDLLARYRVRAQVFLFTTETPEEVGRVIAAYKKGLPPVGGVRRIGQ